MRSAGIIWLPGDRVTANDTAVHRELGISGVEGLVRGSELLTIEDERRKLDPEPDYILSIQFPSKGLYYKILETLVERVDRRPYPHPPAEVPLLDVETSGRDYEWKPEWRYQ